MWGEQARENLQKHTWQSRGSQRVIKGNDPRFQLFLQLILSQIFRVASEAMLGKQAVQTALYKNHKPSQRISV